MADSEFQRPTLAENISMLRNDLFAAGRQRHAPAHG